MRFSRWISFTMPSISYPLLFAALAMFWATPARGDAVLLIGEPINFLGHVAATGHAALLLTNLCSDDYLHVRACRAGEAGTVISRYPGVSGYDWLAVAPVPYFYAVDEVGEIPGTISGAVLDELRERYFNKHLAGLTEPRHHDAWVQLAGSSYRRRIVYPCANHSGARPAIDGVVE